MQTNWIRMKKINSIWNELEQDTSVIEGLIIRRYSGTFLPDVFIGLKVPEQYRCIVANIKASSEINLIPYSNLKDILIELKESQTETDKQVIIKLLNQRHRDIFSVLCEDLMESIKDISGKETLIKELLNRFEKWKSLFDKFSPKGLTPQEQRGLYGELFMLRKFININSDKNYSVNTWVGCSGEIRDFQHAEWGIEVKTTHGNNHQKVQISNERQLDTNNLKNLFLYHLSLDTRHGSGESLNQIVDAILNMLEDDMVAQNRFINKLMEAGFFENHRSFYSKEGYYIRQEKFYLVNGDFPRIEEKEIRAGVGDVSYTLVLAQCGNYILNEDEVFAKIMKNE